MSVDILGTKHGSLLLYVHRNRKAHQDGQPRTATSTFTQLLNSEQPLKEQDAGYTLVSVVVAVADGPCGSAPLS